MTNSIITIFNYDYRLHTGLPRLIYTSILSQNICGIETIAVLSLLEPSVRHE